MKATTPSTKNAVLRDDTLPEREARRHRDLTENPLDTEAEWGEGGVIEFNCFGVRRWDPAACTLLRGDPGWTPMPGDRRALESDCVWYTFIARPQRFPNTVPASYWLRS